MWMDGMDGMDILLLDSLLPGEILWRERPII
jgi:hypothetical protein